MATATGLSAPAAAAAVVAATGPDAPAAQLQPAPLLTGFSSHHFPIESRDLRVRRYFDQGMLLVYGFNSEEAARSFEAALAIDPAYASCWWALAWALGPSINADLGTQAAVRVDRALREARRHARRAAPEQRSLIDALALRHPGNGVIDEAAYAQRMGELARRYPHGAVIALPAAEALMNLHPYDWWAPDGAPQPWTPEIESLLERAMVLQPRLPGATTTGLTHRSLRPIRSAHCAAPNSSRTRCPAPVTCCTCLRTSTCGSDVSTTRSASTNVPLQWTASIWLRSMRRVRTGSATWPTTTISCGPQRPWQAAESWRCRPRSPHGRRRAGPAAMTRARRSRSTMPCCRTSRWFASVNGTRCCARGGPGPRGGPMRHRRSPGVPSVCATRSLSRPTPCATACPRSAGSAACPAIRDRASAARARRCRRAMARRPGWLQPQH